jgi:hypothetical protein
MGEVRPPVVRPWSAWGGCGTHTTEGSDIGCRLDKTKFFVNGAGLFSGVMAFVPCRPTHYAAWPTPHVRSTPPPHLTDQLYTQWTPHKGGRGWTTSEGERGWG